MKVQQCFELREPFNLIQAWDERDSAVVYVDEKHSWRRKLFRPFLSEVRRQLKCGNASQEYSIDRLCKAHGLPHPHQLLAVAVPIPIASLILRR